MIHRTEDSSSSTVQHVGVNHGGLYVPMSKQFLNRTNVVAIFQFRRVRLRSALCSVLVLSPQDSLDASEYGLDLRRRSSTNQFG